MAGRNYLDKLKRYAIPTRNESIGFCAITLVFALIYSWNQWGDASFDVSQGVINYLLAVLLTGSCLFVHHLGQRMAAVKYGFRPEHQVWWTGLWFCLFVAVISRGSITLFLGCSVMMHMLETHRLGFFRYGPNVKAYAMISLWGPLANVLFAGVVKSIELWSPFPISHSVVQAIFVFNLWFAVLNLLPIPPLDGSKLVFESRLYYVFIGITIVSYVAMVYFLDLYSYVLALLIGLVSAGLYYVGVERKL